MVISTDTIRKITIQGEGQQSLDSLSKSLDGVASASDRVASVTDVHTKKALSAADAYKRQTLSVVDGARAQDQLARAMKVVDSALAQGVINTTQHAERVAVLQKRFREAGAAMEGVAGHAAGSSIKIRESLVLLREASRGNFTRMAGSASILAGAFGILTGETVMMAGAVALLAAPFALVGFAMERGSEEAAKLNNALAITGGYSGLTASSFESMAKRISTANGTAIRTTEAGISQLIRSGKFSGDAINYAVDAAERFSRFTGESTETILKEYEGMKGGVAKWGAKHSETYHDLTYAQLDYIDKLEKQGKHEAAEKQLMKDLDDHIKKIPLSLGTAERAWNTLSVAASNAWAAMMNYGKPETLGDKMENITKLIDATKLDLQGKASGKIPNPFPAVTAQEQTSLRAMLKTQGDLHYAIRIENEKAAADAAKAIKEQNKIDARWGPNKAPKAANDNTVSNAKAEVITIQDRAKAQVVLNAALASGAISVDELNKKDKVNSDLAPILKQQADERAKKTAEGARIAEALTPIIEQQRAAFGALYDTELTKKIEIQNDKLGDENKILEYQLKLVGLSNEQRAIRLAMYKKEIELGDQAKTPQGQRAIGLAGDAASGASKVARAALGNANVDAGTALGTNAARVTLASDPKNYIQQQKEAYKEIAQMETDRVLTHAQAEQAMAQVDSDIMKQRLSYASDFFGNLASLSSSKNKELAAIGKAAAISQASIDGVLAVQKALASYPPPINFIEAAAVGVASAVNVAKIAGFADGVVGVSGPGTGTSDSILARLSNGESVVTASATARNANTLAAMNSGASFDSANDNRAPLKVVIEDHGTAKTYTQVAGTSPGEVRLIAEDVLHKKGESMIADHLSNPNSKPRRVLASQTNITRKMNG